VRIPITDAAELGGVGGGRISSEDVAESEGGGGVRLPSEDAAKVRKEEGDFLAPKLRKLKKGEQGTS
jgi:hypothetical protein